jgi:hypothetical protein
LKKTKTKLQDIYTIVSQSTQIKNLKELNLLDHSQNLCSMLKTALDHPKKKLHWTIHLPDDNGYLMGVAFHWHGESSTQLRISNLQ